MKTRTCFPALGALLGLLWSAGVPAQLAAGSGEARPAGAAMDLTGIWYWYGNTCNKEAFGARVKVEQQGNLVSFTWLDECPEHSLMKDKTWSTGTLESDYKEGQPFNIQALHYNRQGNVSGSSARTGYVFQGGQVIVIQERNWRERWFMVRTP